MGKEARNHHYIAQGYLRGFGWKRSKSVWAVNAWDLKETKHFQPSTAGICAQRDFMRFEIEGHEPTKLEHELGRFEGKVRDALLNVSRTRTFQGEDRILILNFMAMLAVRSPQIRENWRDFQERVSKGIMSMALATEERWNGQMRQMKAAGQGVNEDVTYEQMRDFVARGEYEVKVAREVHIAMELKTHAPVLELLAARKWKLYYAGEGEGTFVTTDRPVTITWNHPDKVPFMMRQSPGFAMKDTEVVFPITRDCFILGRFDIDEETAEEAYTPFIAACNTLMIGNCHGLVIGAEKAFPYMVPPSEIYFDEGVFARLVEFQKQEAERLEPEVMEWNVEGGPPMPQAVETDAKVDGADLRFTSPPVIPEGQ